MSHHLLHLIYVEKELVFRTPSNFIAELSVNLNLSSLSLCKVTQSEVNRVYRMGQGRHPCWMPSLQLCWLESNYTGWSPIILARPEVCQSETQWCGGQVSGLVMLIARLASTWHQHPLNHVEGGHAQGASPASNFLFICSQWQQCEKMEMI